MNTTSPVFKGLRCIQWIKKLVLVLLLALPLTPAVAQAPRGGFGLVPVEWCTFYPQLPFCRGSGTTVITKQIAPQGMGFVPMQWCIIMPQLPICPPTADKLLTEVTDFGSNPGQLQMFKYVPKNLGQSRPLVVALHGCTQTASSYDDEPGWVKFADKFHFALLLPQQTSANNLSKCFRWFDSNQNERDKGEALSIRQMIEKMKTDLNIDPARIYVTGLSGGGAMTAVMMAAYPDVFAGGAIIAGIPYKCARDQGEAFSACGVFGTQMKALTPSQWGDLVRHASSFGAFPRVSIWQGDQDHTVNPQDENELMKQWTNVLGNGQTPQIDETLNGNSNHPVHHQVFKDSNGKAMVETFLVKNMDHGTPIDPGSGNDQCGTAAPFILNVGICSSFLIAKFWGVDSP